MSTNSISLQASLVSVDWLYKHLNHSNLMVLDASMPVINSADQNTNILKIVGARFANLKLKFSNPDGIFPNTVPTVSQFEMAASELGINNDSVIIVYDSKGTYSSPRLWWLFKSFGHDQVAVLDGGLPEWIAKGYATEVKKDEKWPIKKFRAKQRRKYILDFMQISATSHNSNDYVILDARSRARFEGKEPEPRKGLRCGIIPNSINMPYTEVLADGKLKSRDELKKLFHQLEFQKKTLICSCGSGITACILALAAHQIGITDVAIYDGSWTEYGTLIK